MTQPQLYQNMTQPQCQQNPQFTQIQQPDNNSLILRGAMGRAVSGMLLFLSGMIGIILAVILVEPKMFIQLEEDICHDYDTIAWGIWGGVFAMTTGCLGVVSTRSKCGVSAFLVLSIIQAIMSTVIAVVYGFQTACEVHQKDYIYDYGSSQFDPFHSFDPFGPFDSFYSHFHHDLIAEEYRMYLLLYILMLVTSASQILMSIIGASFTCTAICSSSDPLAQQLVGNHSSVMPFTKTGAPGQYGTWISANGQLRFDNSYGQPLPQPDDQIANTQHQPLMK